MEPKKVFQKSVKELAAIRENLTRLALAHIHQKHRKSAANYEAALLARRLGKDEELNSMIEAIIDCDETIAIVSKWI